MKSLISALVSFMVFSFAAFADVQAADARILVNGDRITLSAGEQLSAPALRKKLRELGYFALGHADHTGNIIKQSGVGPDRRIYRLRVHMKTGEIISARRIRHVY